MAENKADKIVATVGVISYLVTGFCLGWMLGLVEEKQDLNN